MLKNFFNVLREISRGLRFYPEKNYTANLMILSKLTGESLLRVDGRIGEYMFWDQWFATKGLKWPQEYTNRLKPDSVVETEHAEILDKLSASIPLTTWNIPSSVSNKCSDY